MCKFDNQKPSSSSSSNDSVAHCDFDGLYKYFNPNVCRETDANIQPLSIYKIQHISQRFTYDCGLACALMVLRALNHDTVTLTTLQTIVNTNSIWSIDIAHCMARCGIAHQIFTTTCIGANPQHVNERFYANNINQDIDRVNRLFRDAHKSNIQVVDCSLSANHLQSIVMSNTFLIIALIDKSILIMKNYNRQRSNNSNHMVVENESIVQQQYYPPHPSRSYTGHYIVLHGFDPVQQEYLIKDPADFSLQRIHADDLEAARKAYGTDEDLLFIPITTNES